MKEIQGIYCTYASTLLVIPTCPTVESLLKLRNDDCGVHHRRIHLEVHNLEARPAKKSVPLVQSSLHGPEQTHYLQVLASWPYLAASVGMTISSRSSFESGAMAGMIFFRIFTALSSSQSWQIERR